MDGAFDELFDGALGSEDDDLWGSPTAKVSFNFADEPEETQLTFPAAAPATETLNDQNSPGLTLPLPLPPLPLPLPSVERPETIRTLHPGILHGNAREVIPEDSTKYALAGFDDPIIDLNSYDFTGLGLGNPSASNGRAAATASAVPGVAASFPEPYLHGVPPTTQPFHMMAQVPSAYGFPDFSGFPGPAPSFPWPGPQTGGTPLVRQRPQVPIPLNGRKGREAYDAPPQSRAWGKLNQRTNQHQFQYSPRGVELKMDLRFEKEDMLLFMTQAPQRGLVSPDRRELTVWIQNTPFNANDRYHHGTASSKCRWRKCPDPRNTILKGFWRVALDERSADRQGLGTPVTEDPYLNAGYMHLYCFEELFDLALLMKQTEDMEKRSGAAPFTIMPDDRDFPHETDYRNRMALTRDHKVLLDVFEDWKAEQYQKLAHLHHRQPPPRPLSLGDVEARKRKKTDRLWYKLTEKHISLEVKGRAAARQKRNGADIGQHVGDLRKFLDLKRDMLRLKQERDDEGEGEGDGGGGGGGGGQEGAADATTYPAMATATATATATASAAFPFPMPMPMPMTRPPETPLFQIGHMVHQLQDQPHTRKRSAAAAHLVEEASHARVTRSVSSVLQPLILSEPPHVRRRLQNLLVQEPGTLGGERAGEREGRHDHDHDHDHEPWGLLQRDERDRLKERLDGMPLTKTRAVDRYVEKLDAKDGLVKRFNSHSHGE